MISSSQIYLFFSALFIWGILLPQAYAETITRGPYLQMGTPDSIIIHWRTDADVASAVDYGTSLSSLSSSASDSTLRTEHELTLTGLTPNTQYYYTIKNDTGGILAGGDATYNFVTSPAISTVQPIRIWAIGDAGTANSNAAAVYSAYLDNTGSQHTDLWLMLGDNAYNDGTDTEYQNAVFNMYPELLRNTVVWSTLGNHDGHTADSATQTGPYYDIFNLPENAQAGGVASGTEAYYSFDYGNIHFICLESYETDRSETGTMLTWLGTDLAATTQDWIIAFWHHPPYTKGSHNSDTESQLIQMRENALPILEDHGVDLVLTGHSHSYERSFLLDGHYGLSPTFDDHTMKLDGGDGCIIIGDGCLRGNGAYDKTSTPNNAGAVYIVAGSSGKTSGGTLNHPAMYASINSLGSVILTVNGNQLDASFLDQNGTEKDKFTIIKGADNWPPGLSTADAQTESTVKISFTEALELTSASNTENYAIDQGINVISAVLSPDARVVTLTTSTLTEGIDYTVTVNSVLDLNSNTIELDSQISFSYLNLINIAFQEGINGYTGTIDTYLSQNNPSTAYGTSTSLLVDGDDPSGTNNDLSTLLGWDISAIPAGAIIQTAEFNINIFNISNSNYSVFEMKQGWIENQATWNEFASAQSWDVAGGQGAADRGIIELGAVNPASTGNHTVTLNADGIALVQAWVDGSTVNNGIIIASSTATDGADFRSSEYSSARPELKVTYSLPSSNGDTQAPSTPVNLLANSVTENSVSLSWNNSTDNVAVAAYEIFRDGTSVGSSNSNSFIDNNLQANSTYDYQVTAFDAIPNTSALSSILSVSTLATTSSLHVNDILMSVTPQGKKWLTASAHVHIVDNNGSALSNATISGTWSGNLVNQNVSDLTLSDGTFTFLAPKVAQNVSGEFTFSVDDVNLSGFNYLESDNVETAACIDTLGVTCQPDQGGLSAPSGLSSSYDGTVNLNWNNVLLASSYNIYRTTVSGGAYSLLMNSTLTSFQDDTVSTDTDYYYVVTALDATDESPDSNEIHIYTGISQGLILHTDNVSVTLKQTGNKWSANAVINVVNADDNQAVANATVTGSWSLNGADKETDSASTDSSGSASVQSSKYNASTGDQFRFTVTNINASNASYDDNNVSAVATVP